MSDNFKPKLLEKIPKDTYSSIFDMVKRQDELSNNRLSWLLTSQTILFGALALSSESSGEKILTAIPVIGILIATVILISNTGNIAIVRILKNDLEGLFKNNTYSEEQETYIAKPYGGFEITIWDIYKNSKIFRNLLSPGMSLPLIFIGAWIWYWRLSSKCTDNHALGCNPLTAEVFKTNLAIANLYQLKGIE